MKIEIDPTTFGMVEDPETGELEPGPDMRDQLVSALVQRFSSSASKSIGDAVSEQVRAIVDAEARARVRAVLDAPVQPVSRWNGQPEGEAFRVETLIEKAVTKYIASPGGSGSYNRTSNNMGELIDELVKQALNTTLKPTVDAAKKRMTDEIVRLALEGAVAAIAPKVR